MIVFGILLFVSFLFSVYVFVFATRNSARLNKIEKLFDYPLEVSRDKKAMMSQNFCG